MNPTRHDFLKGALAALGFSALPGGLFAAPKGWKIKKKPNLIFGILSDTHLQSGWDGVTPHGGFPLMYVTNAMKLFRQRHIDAFMHLGDMAHRGKNVEAQYHRDIFDKFFPRGVRSSDNRKVEKLLVVGNHELYGDAAGGAGAWAPHIWKDPEERKKHVLCGDLPKYWERIWGEKYEECWHKEVNGYHFFGRHWETAEMKLAEFINSKAEECSLKGIRPFFILSHARNHHQFRRSLKEFPNAVSFFGHWHCSNADWKTILELELKTPTVLRIKIPLADGNPESRVFAYDVVIVGEDRKKRLFKSVYFEGCNVAPGHEPNNGITEVEIPVAELPAGKNLTIAIRPISSLGTIGKSIGATIRV